MSFTQIHIFCTHSEIHRSQIELNWTIISKPWISISNFFLHVPQSNLVDSSLDTWLSPHLPPTPHFCTLHNHSLPVRGRLQHTQNGNTPRKSLVQNSTFLPNSWDNFASRTIGNVPHSSTTVFSHPSPNICTVSNKSWSTVGHFFARLCPHCCSYSDRKSHASRYCRQSITCHSPRSTPLRWRCA